MADMKMKDLVAALLKLDQERPLHKRGGLGNHPQVQDRHIKTWLVEKRLMKHLHPDESYYADVKDETFTTLRETFGPEFEAVVLDL
jgi:hypothetical protein